MSYLVLARKFRPQRFDEVVGQEHVTRTLINAIKMNRVAHGFIFSGVRGVGKTSMARILAKSLNCSDGPTDKPCGVCDSCKAITAGSAVDVIEIDGASNNSVEDIRELRDTIPYRPQLGRFKIYVIDEVHMLSVSAFNALLKTLEEPPPHVKFIFATTEPHKIPATILSRCQRYDFRRIPTAAVIERIRKILNDEGIESDDGALATIGREAEGSMRDALSVLDQVLATGPEKITTQAVTDLLGVVSRKIHYDLSESLLKGDARRCLSIIRDIDRQGFEIVVFAKGFLEHLRNLVVAAICSGESDLFDLPEEEINDLVQQAKSVATDTLHRCFKHFAEAYEEIARSSFPRILLEATLARLASLPELVPAEEILKRLEAISLSGPGEPRSGRGGEGSVSANGYLRRQEENGRDSGSNAIGSAGQMAQEDTVVQNKKAVAGQVTEDSNLSSELKSMEPFTEKEWKQLLSDFSATRPAKSSIVERGRPALDSTADCLVLEFDAGDNFTLSRARDADFQRDLTGFLSKRAGRPVKLVVEAAELGTQSTLAKERLVKQEALRQREAEAKEHPMVQKATRTFGGTISRVQLDGEPDVKSE